MLGCETQFARFLTRNGGPMGRYSSFCRTDRRLSLASIMALLALTPFVSDRTVSASGLYAPLATADADSPCKAINVRTGEQFTGVTAFADALADVSLSSGDTIQISGTCTGNFIVTQ